MPPKPALPSLKLGQELGQTPVTKLRLLSKDKPQEKKPVPAIRSHEHITLSI